jgi:uncharacterized protein YkwD
MQIRLLIGLGVVVFLAASPVQAQVVEEDNTEILKPPAGTYDPTNVPDLAATGKRIVTLTNVLRREEKLPPTAVNDKLATAARYFADYMATNSKFGHKADGNRPSDRAAKYGYDYCIIAENIAYQFSSRGFTTDELADQFCEGWKESSGHLKNMLDPDVTETGVAVAVDPETGCFFAVAMFGRPRSMSVEFTIANQSRAVVHYEMGSQTFELAPEHARTHRVCRPRDTAFKWPDGPGDVQKFQPTHGDRFVIRTTGDQLQIRKE